MKIFKIKDRNSIKRLIFFVALLGCIPSINVLAESSENNVDHFCLQLRKISEEEIKSHLMSHDISVCEFADHYGAQG